MRFDKSKIPQKYRSSISDCYRDEDGCWVIFKADGKYSLSETYGSDHIIHEDTPEEVIRALDEYAVKSGISVDNFIVGNTACTFKKKNTAGGIKFDAKFVTITKVGSKYVYCDDGYAYQQHPDRRDCFIRRPPKGYTTDGTLLFLTETKANQEADSWEMYEDLKRVISTSKKDDFTLEQLQAAANIFGTTLPFR